MRGFGAFFSVLLSRLILSFSFVLSCMKKYAGIVLRERKLHTVFDPCVIFFSFLVPSHFPLYKILIAWMQFGTSYVADVAASLSLCMVNADVLLLP